MRALNFFRVWVNLVILPLNILVVKEIVVVPVTVDRTCSLQSDTARNLSCEDTYFLKVISLYPISDSRSPIGCSQGLRGEGGTTRPIMLSTSFFPFFFTCRSGGSHSYVTPTTATRRPQRRRRQPSREMSDRMATAINQNFFQPPLAFTTSALKPAG